MGGNGELVSGEMCVILYHALACVYRVDRARYSMSERLMIS